MPESIDFLRRAHARNTARRVGLHPEQERHLVAQLKAALNESEILAYPENSLVWQPLQDSNGNFYFIPDYDTPDDGSIVR